MANVKGDAFTKELRARIKELDAQYYKQYRKSFVDDDSNSYDASQRLNGHLTEARIALALYLKFKREEADKKRRGKR